MLNDELLNRAATIAREQLLAELSEQPLLNYTFSETFDRKMKRIINIQKKHLRSQNFIRYGKRAAVIMIAGFIGFSICVLSVDAWRVKLFKMVEQKFPKYSEISYEPVDGRSNTDSPQIKLTEYRPGYIPQGYRLTEQHLSKHINWTIYTNINDDYIAFDQSVLGTGRSNINTEGSELVEFELNGDVAYKMTNRGSHFVLWSDEQYEYMVLTSEQEITLEQAVKIAQSVTVCPKDAYHPPKLEIQLSDLPVKYSKQMAIENGDVVISEGQIYNVDELDTFFTSYENGIPAVIRLADFDNGKPVTRELYYDGLRINCTSDETRDPASGEEGTVGRNYRSISREQEEHFMVVYLTDKEEKREELFRYIK